MCQSVPRSTTGHGHSPWPWPMAVGMGHGSSWPVAGHGHNPRAMAVAREPWVMAMARGGHEPRAMAQPGATTGGPWAMAITHGS
jgi:hypothetical protein